LQSALANPPGLSTQFNPETLIDQRYTVELATFLESNGETRGYSTYWVSYPLAFLSGESLIFIPRLPYHKDLRYTSRDDRYPPYQNLVAASQRAAYITVNHPMLNDLLRDSLRIANIRWEEQRIGDYQVFYHLSGRVDLPAFGISANN
ncbi:MAG: hypothetical protein PHQ40_14215, partial [Anaerolineaceae bacterium]|nr:hypothetical protein [Anaerolineaceae bacterium]